MLKALLMGKQVPTIIAGISDENIRKLRNGHPILSTLKSFGYDVPANLLIFYGKTPQDLQNSLESWGWITENTRGLMDPRLDQEAALRRENKQILICTVGLPRSGKSTWAHEEGFPTVSPDAIRFAIHGKRYDVDREEEVWKTVDIMIISLFRVGHTTVILDATNTSRKRRDHFYHASWGTAFKVFDTPKEVCIERAGDDVQLISVIERMADNWEPLRGDEVHWI